MFKIIKTMKSQWKAVIVVVLLLFVQAICDLSLPNYTSQLIDVGIQNSGVEYATPTVIRAEQFEKVQMFMTEEERTSWQSAYAPGEDGNYRLTEEASKNMEELDKTFTTPIVITYLSSQMDADTMAGIQQKALQSGEQMDLSLIHIL